MSNSFYNHSTFPTPNAPGSSAQMRAELDLITAGFNKLPTLSGNGYKVAMINAAGTALVASSALQQLALTQSTIDSTPIGGTTRAAGAFTTLSANGAANLGSAVTIAGGVIDNTVIGGTTPAAGNFTTLAASSITGNLTGNVTGNLTGNVTAGSGTSSFNNVTINGTLDMNAGTVGTITGLATPTNSSDAAPKGYVDAADALKLNLSGGTMSGAIAMGTNRITGLGDPSSTQDAATKNYTDTQDALKLNLSGGTMSGNLAMGTNRITGVGDPVGNQDAATKAYVDSLAQGLDVKASVRAATTGNIASLSGTTTIDGVALSVGDRVLVKDQTTQSQNGIYVVAAGGWGRSADMDVWTELPGAFFFVENGSTNANSGWVCTVSPGGTIGSTAVTFQQFSGAGQINAGSGLTKSGNTLNVNTASSARIVVNADTIDLATTGVVAGTYRSVTVDSYGRVTTGTNPTTLAGYGITDAYTTTQVDSALALKLNLSGGTMSGPITFAAGQTWPTFNQNTTGNAATATALTSTLGVSGGGTGLTTFAVGNILYGNGASPIGSSANLFWDSVNNRLGLGGDNPQGARLDLYGNQRLMPEITQQNTVAAVSTTSTLNNIAGDAYVGGGWGSFELWPSGTEVRVYWNLGGMSTYDTALAATPGTAFSISVYDYGTFSTKFVTGTLVSATALSPTVISFVLSMVSTNADVFNPYSPSGPTDYLSVYTSSTTITANNSSTAWISGESSIAIGGYVVPVSTLTVSGATITYPGLLNISSGNVIGTFSAGTARQIIGVADDGTTAAISFNPSAAVKRWSVGNLPLKGNSSSVFIGHDVAPNINSSAFGNIFIGRAVGGNITSVDSPDSNVVIGESAAYNLTSASSNVVIGPSAGYSLSNGNQNVFIGMQAGYGSASVSSFAGVCIGAYAGLNLSTGNSNTLIGTSAGSAITSGSNHTLLGRYNGNENSLDIRTLSNYVVLSDGSGARRLTVNNLGAWSFNNATPAYGTAGQVMQSNGSSSAPSWSSIKTINSNSLIGSGDISVAGVNGVASTSWFAIGTAIQRGVAGLTITPNTSNGAADITFNRNSTTSQSNVVGFQNAGTTVGFIGYTNTTVTYNTGSDARLKENVSPAPASGAIIDAIEIVQHDWIAGGHADFSVIAQDLHQVFPQAVSPGDDGAEIEQTWGVDYSKLVPLLVKEIQSLRARVNALESA